MDPAWADQSFDSKERERIEEARDKAWEQFETICKPPFQNVAKRKLKGHHEYIAQNEDLFEQFFKFFIAVLQGPRRKEIDVLLARFNEATKGIADETTEELEWKNADKALEDAIARTVFGREFLALRFEKAQGKKPKRSERPLDSVADVDKSTYSQLLRVEAESEDLRRTEIILDALPDSDRDRTIVLLRILPMQMIKQNLSDLENEDHPTRKKIADVLSLTKRWMLQADNVVLEDTGEDALDEYIQNHVERRMPPTIGYEYIGQLFGLTDTRCRQIYKRFEARCAVLELNEGHR